MASAELPSKNLTSIEESAEPPAILTRRANPRVKRSLPAFWFAVRTSACIWIGDVLLLLRDPPEYPKPATTGMFAALFLGLVTFGAAGLVLQALWSLGRIGGAGASASRLRDWLLGSEPRAQIERSATLLALPVVIAVYALATFAVSRRLILGMARPEFAALAIVGSQLVIATLAVLSFWPARAFGLLVARGFALVPGLKRAWQVTALLVFAAALALGAFGWTYREPLSYLPWIPIAQVALAVVISLGFGLAFHRWRPAAVLWPLRVVAVSCTIAGAIGAFTLAAGSGYSRRIAEHSSLSGHFAYGALRKAFDRDRDGYLSLLGDGDCASSDSTRHPGATDAPGNRIDEDCDGFDLDPSALAPRGKYAFPVPDELPRRPPIVLLTIDAFAADRMKKLGGKRGVTPNLDKLAERSSFFTSAYSQGPSTRLSFPSMFTSRWDSQIRQKLVGKHPFPIDPSETMLADLLRGAGYDTVAVLGDGYFSERRWHGITRGFTRVVNSAIEGPRQPHNGTRVTEAVLAQLSARRDKPLFLWAHYYDAHSPHVQPKDVKVFGTERSDVYDAELFLVDREVGKLIEAIDRQWPGQALVIVTADHGIAFDPPRHEKFNYGYDLSSAVLHVPLIFHASFLPPRVVDGPVSTMDIMPTLLNLLRLPPLAALEGTSLVPELLRGERQRPPELMHQMFLEERLWKEEEPLERVALRTDRFNLLHDRKSGFFELYDYRRDYFETRDLALDPAYEANLRELKRRLSLLVYVARKPDAEAKPGEPNATNKVDP